MKPSLLIASALALISLSGCGKRPATVQEGDGGRPAVPAGHLRMVGLLATLRTECLKSNPWLGDDFARSLQSDLEINGGSMPPGTQLSTAYQLGLAKLNLGEIEESIRLLTQCDALAERLGAAGDARNRILTNLGTAYLRLGETQNCCLKNSPESCILPLRGAAIHTEAAGSENAIACFQRVLDNGGANHYRQEKCRWLLNLAYMTLGRYPADVPSKYLIDGKFLQRVPGFPRFANIAANIGTNTFDLAGGMCVDDFDGDGDLDMITSTLDPSESLHYFENGGDGRFRERSGEAGFDGLFGGLNLVQADYDNDGDLDLLVLRGAWFGPDGRHPNSLLQNDGHGDFIDVTFAAGLGEVHYPTQTASWADYDNDGDLDLYIGNESAPGFDAPCQLFRNDGAGPDGQVTFSDVAEAAGVAATGFIKAVGWGDYDGDRLPDLAVSDHAGPNLLYHNNGDGTFTDQAVAAGVDRPLRSFPLWFWDFDNDGALDLFVASYAAQIGDVVGYYETGKAGIELPGHYRGDGDGHFTNVATEQRFDYPMLPMGANFGDLDNDGFLDVYLGTGEPAISVILPNLMFLNNGGGGFTDVTMAGGFGHLQKGHAICFADFDGDGDQDVFEQLGGAKPVDRYSDALFENPGFGKHWIKVRVVGSRSNRSGIGARIHLRVGLGAGRPARSIYRHVNSGASFGANPLCQHIGLGEATTIDMLEVYWPTSDITDVFHDVPADGEIIVSEGRGILGRP